MRVVPAPTIVTLFPVMVATAVLELSYVNDPSLLEDGSCIVNDASPNVFGDGTVKAIDGDISLTIVKAGFNERKVKGEFV
jgi:hypothetical protein